MQATVITRSRATDYGYLGAPDDEWWSPAARFADVNDADVIVRRSPHGLQVLVSGIPSARRDLVERAIRVTMILTGEDRPGTVRTLVHLALSEDGRATLGKLLDTVITEQAVVDLLDRPGADATGLGVEVLDAVDTGPSFDPLPPEAEEPGSWVGPVADERARTAFLARLDMMIAGARSGYLLATHKLVSVRGAEEALGALGGSAVFLLHETTLKAVTPLGKAQAPDRAPARSRTRVVLVVVIAAVAALLIYLLLRRFGFR